MQSRVPQSVLWIGFLAFVFYLSSVALDRWHGRTFRYPTNTNINFNQASDDLYVIYHYGLYQACFEGVGSGQRELNNVTTLITFPFDFDCVDIDEEGAYDISDPGSVSGLIGAQLPLSDFIPKDDFTAVRVFTAAAAAFVLISFLLACCVRNPTVPATVSLFSSICAVIALSVWLGATYDKGEFLTPKNNGTPYGGGFYLFLVGSLLNIVSMLLNYFAAKAPAYSLS